MTYKPPFTVSSKAISAIAEISALVERYAIRLEQSDALKLRKANKIKTVHSSLAIAGNSLSAEQVSDILDGKNVVAPLREIQEVKNALAVYDTFSLFDPFSIEDLLKAHQTMMTALVDEAGQFRRGSVGVFSEDKPVHIAPPAHRVPELISDLFYWLKNSQDHLLIRSCVFHYEFEFIHPFADGNGRIGRLWQSLILSKLHPVFQHLPVETKVHNNQANYYQAIYDSTRSSDSGIFIDFMLEEILNALKQHKGEEIGTVTRVLEFIKQTPGVRANVISAELQIPIKTLRHHLKQLFANDIEFRGAPRTGRYFVKER